MRTARLERGDGLLDGEEHPFAPQALCERVCWTSSSASGLSEASHIRVPFLRNRASASTSILSAVYSNPGVAEQSSRITRGEVALIRALSFRRHSRHCRSRCDPRDGR